MPVSPGQSGGPLLNVRGEVIGIAVAAHADGQCCALPIKAARKISDDILEFGQAQHPWVGLNVSECSPTVDPVASDQRQVFVEEVYSNTPAAAAGFCNGDILVSITSNEVRRSRMSSIRCSIITSAIKWSSRCVGMDWSRKLS